MIARSEKSLVTVGVSTERGAVHAVALDDSDVPLPDRILVHRVLEVAGTGRAEVAAVVARVMDEVARELGPAEEIAGAAITYRDPAERRAIVTGLATGPWRSASLVSTKSAHLSAAAAMTWLAEFDHLLIGEVVPGYQAFTLVDAARSRVLAATGQSAAAPTMAAMSAAVGATRDQIEAAQVRPDAVVLIGSAADHPAVMGAVGGFGAPVIPCGMARSAPAAGAALCAMTDLVDVVVPLRSEQQRRGPVMIVAAAGVLASGMTGGGAYLLVNGHSQPTSVTADAMSTVPVGEQAADRGSADTPQSRTFRPEAASSVPETGGLNIPSDTGSVEHSEGSGYTRPWYAAPTRDYGTESDLSTGAAGPEVRTAVPGTEPGSMVPDARSVPHTIPAPMRRAESPTGLLFPGEELPPPAFTPESYAWWGRHLRLLVQWATQFALPEPDQPPSDRAVPDRVMPDQGTAYQGVNPSTVSVATTAH
ncbi:hypothetical protein [Nocardia brevicatena]|uniref:hypothetical protein n=1 Tax=Nocardia brevicatena TaxID=37327 RepID=UPI0005946E42|nr:hypothetical protein [Nocardia brevicatena]